MIEDEAAFKRDVMRRLIDARKSGLSVGKLANASGYGVGIHMIYDMLEAKQFPIEDWETVDRGLKLLGY